MSLPDLSAEKARYKAQANPCANNNVNQQPSVSGDQEEVDSDIECEFHGPVEIEEGLE